YENRIQRIIDTMKSGVKIPAVTISDQTVYLWKRKFRILQVIRDYLPFLVCIIAYHRLTQLIPHAKSYNIDRVFMSFDRFVIESLRLKTLSFFGHSREFRDVLSLSYKTYLLCVPVIATYLYMIKQFKKFREFLLAITLGSVITIIVSIIFPSIGLEAILNNSRAPLSGTISIPAIYTVIVLVFSLKYIKPLASFYIPIASLFFISQILSYSSYMLAIVISAIIGLVAVPLARLIQGAWN
ncbi:MAG: hypothetical protein WCQ47_08565, partial [bacterium]